MTEYEYQNNNPSRIERLWNMACQAVQSRDFNRALFICREIREAAPDYFPAKGLLSQLEQAYNQAEWLYRDIERRQDSAGLNELMHMAGDAYEIFPDHPLRPLVMPKLKRRNRESVDFLKLGIEAQERGDIALEYKYYQLALKVNPHEPMIQELVWCASELLRRRNARS